VNFLFAMYQGGGNIPLIAPVAGRLVERGHRVRVLAGPGIFRVSLPVSRGMVDRLRGLGCELATFEAPHVNPYDSAEAPKGATLHWTPRVMAREARVAQFSLWSSSWVRNVSQEIERGRPNAVVADFRLLGALAAAEAAGVPSAALVHNIPPPLAGGAMPPASQGFMPARDSREALRYAKWRSVVQRIYAREGLRFHNKARGEVGLAPLPQLYAQYSTAGRVLMLVSKAFDLDGDVPANTRYVGTPLDDAAAAGTWTPPWPGGDTRPLLLISLSTLAQGQAPLLKRVIEAARELPLRVVVTLGPSMKRDEFTAPVNTVFETFVPHSAVLPHCAAVVTQCGLGALIKTLRHGVPVVCVPIAGDQPDNAARAVRRGAGVRLTSDATVEEIRHAIRSVVETERYTINARNLGGVLALDDGASNAADELEALAAER
jgi:MGT family glycosyltransferase